MKRTQTLDIKRYLENNPKGITQKKAYDMFGVTRLADIIYRLKRKPYNMPIVTMTKIVPNRYGGVSNVAVYVLKDGQWE